MVELLRSLVTKKAHKRMLNFERLNMKITHGKFPTSAKKLEYGKLPT